MEPESLAAWQTGKPAFMRNWPYAYGISEDTAKLKGKFAVAPLPSYAGAGKASILGGGNSVISRFLKNPGGALAVVDFLASQDWQTTLTAEFSQMSPFKATYDQPSVKKAIPFDDEIRRRSSRRGRDRCRRSIRRSRRRSTATSTMPSPGAGRRRTAMKRAQADIEGALATF